MPKALVVGIHAWNSPLQVGSHALARGLAERGWQVAYVSAPLTPFHRLLPSSQDLSMRRMVHREGGGLDTQSGVWHYVPYSLIAPDHRPGLSARWVFEQWQRVSLPSVVRQVVAQGFGDVDMLLLNSHFQPFWLNAIAYQRAVYRLADWTPGFPGCSAAAQAVEAGIIRRVDLVVTSAHSLADPVRQLGPRSVAVVPNGIRYDEFAGNDASVPVEYLGLEGPIAVYVGAFGPWIDLPLIRACAAARPDMHFVLIGPAEGLTKVFDGVPNVHLLGSRSRRELVPYLHHAHVGLMPFDRAACPDLVDHIHPLKLYEYLACGLPVISTDWAELRRFSHPATLCTTARDFVAALPRDAAPRAGAVERRAFARQADWSFRIDELLGGAGFSAAVVREAP